MDGPGMVHQKKRSDLPRCAHCGGVAVLCHGTESGNYWFDCERFWEREAGYHTTTGFYLTEEEAVASWRRNVAHDVEKFKSPAGGVQSQEPRNGETEARRAGVSQYPCRKRGRGVKPFQ